MNFIKFKRLKYIFKFEIFNLKIKNLFVILTIKNIFSPDLVVIETRIRTVEHRYSVLLKNVVKLFIFFVNFK